MLHLPVLMVTMRKNKYRRGWKPIVISSCLHTVSRSWDKTQAYTRELQRTRDRKGRRVLVCVHLGPFDGASVKGQPLWIQDWPSPGPWPHVHELLRARPGGRVSGVGQRFKPQFSHLLSSGPATNLFLCEPQSCYLQSGRDRVTMKNKETIYIRCLAYTHIYVLSTQPMVIIITFLMKSLGQGHPDRTWQGRWWW